MGGSTVLKGAGILAVVAVLLGPLRSAGPSTPQEFFSPCHFLSPPTVVLSEPSTLLQYWLEAARPELEALTLPDSPALHAFRAEMSERLDTDPLALLRAQLPLVEGGDAANVRATLDGTAGTIRPMNCLEGLLLATQAERSAAQGRSMFTHPTEFLAYVLQRGDTLKIWYYTVDQPGIRGLGTLHGPVQEDLEDGWVVVTNLHNHNFFPAEERVLGGVAPSATDVQAFRNFEESLGLRRAAITNGFHTLVIEAAAFPRLSDGRDPE
jgi:hypothetical protein